MNTQTSSIETPIPLIQNEENYLANSKFESCDELLKSVREFYFTKGYGLSIRNSKKDDFVTLKCDRGGKYRDVRGIEGNRKKNTSSRLVDCPFKLVGKKGHRDGLWFFQRKYLIHNHEPSSDISGHPSFRQLEPENIQIVKDMTLSGIPPRQIISALREQNPNIPTTSRTIYNVKKKIRKDNLEGKSEINALFEEFEKGGFLHDEKHDSQGHITHLFMAHPLSVKLAKLFSKTFVMDCTYKTNRFKMPLLDIIGVSCFNTSFYSGFAFLKTETVESYEWALRAFKKIFGHDNLPFVIMSDRELALMNGIKTIFPSATNLLCIWHIEKNVVSNCKGFFEDSDEFDIFLSTWNNVVYSITEHIFVNNWHEFELLYEDKKDAIGYIKKNWLPWKEKFVSAWTEKHLHFGNRSSSRAEGAHAKLKMYLQVSTGGFNQVKEKICLAVKHEFNEIKVKLASEKIKVLHQCNTPVYKNLLYHVSQFALKKICNQYEKINKGTLAPCTGHFMATMGLPCAHKIKNSREKELSLDLVHPHWRIDTLTLNLEDGSHNDDTNTFVKLLDELYAKYQVWPLHKKEAATSMITNLINQSDTLFEPMVQRPRGRPPKCKKKKGPTSTTRNPSRFEYVEASQGSNGMTNEVSYIYGENNMIDLNVDPNHPSGFMLFE